MHSVVQTVRKFANSQTVENSGRENFQRENSGRENLRETTCEAVDALRLA
jgi:hypothetical protein